MPVLTHFAWLLVLLPGLWVVRRFTPALAAIGPMAQIGLGYLATFCLVSPLSLVGYVLGLPVAVVGVGLGCMVAASVPLLWRDRASGPPPGADVVDFAGGLCLLVMLTMQARLGGWLDGDATYHLGRIRDVLEHGISSRDILVRPERFHPTYHANLLHAVYASLAWATTQSPIDVWFDTQTWATVVVAAGHYLLGYVLTGGRVGGWALCVLVLGARASVTYTLYPNGLGIGWLLPTLSALAISVSVGAWPGAGAGGQPSARRQVIGALAAAAVVIGQVHALYALYALALCVPVLAVRAALSRGVVRGGATRALAVLLLCVPPVLIAADRSRAEISPAADAPPRPAEDVLTDAALSRWGARQERNAWQRRSPDEARTAALRAGGGHLEKRLDVEGGRHVLRPRHMGGAGWLVAGFLALCFVACFDRTRRHGWAVVLATASVLAAVLFDPTLCTLAVGTVQSAFIVARLATWLSTLLFCGLAGVFAFLVGRSRFRASVSAWLTAALLPVLGASATALPGHAPRAIDEHLRQVFAPAAERRARQKLLHARQRFLRAHLPVGEPVLTDLRFARHVTMLHDVPVVAADRGMAPATDVARRIRDVGIMVAPRTPPVVRGALLAHHGVRRLVYRHRDARRYRWAIPLARSHHSGADLHVVEFRPSGARDLQ